MKKDWVAKLLAFCVLLVGLLPACVHAQTLTPNIQLQVPAFNQSNWQVPLNYDLNRLDLLLSGNLPIPAINPTTFQFAPTTYAALPACGPSTNGLTAAISDGTTSVWGALVSGGSGTYTWVYCQGYGAGAGYYVQPFAGGSFNFMNNPMTTEGDMIYQHSLVPWRLGIGAPGTCLLSNGTDPIWTSCAGTAGTIWSSLTDPIINLVLDMGTGYSTEMDYAITTFTPSLILQSTNAATSSTANVSPALELGSFYWNGSASVPNLWAMDTTLGTGTNANTTLQFYVVHGTGGTASVSVPNLIDTASSMHAHGVLLSGGSAAPQYAVNPTTIGFLFLSGGSSADPYWGFPLQYFTSAQCTATGSPAVCGSASTGQVFIPAGVTSIQVNTTSVDAVSDILLSRDNSLGPTLSLTCNTQSSLVLGAPYVSAKTNGSSFTISVDVAPTTNALCLDYAIVN